MRRLVVALALLCVAFSAQAGPLDDPLGLIKAIYKSYVDDKPTPALDSDVYSRRLQGLIDAEKKATPQGESGRIDWDVFVDGNDWALTKLKIVLVSRAGSKAQVRATFHNHRKPRDMLFDLVRENGRWRIDEMREMQPGGRWTLSKILTGAPDAFPDEKK